MKVKDELVKAVVDEATYKIIKITEEVDNLLAAIEAKDLDGIATTVAVMQNIIHQSAGAEQPAEQVLMENTPAEASAKKKSTKKQSTKNKKDTQEPPSTDNAQTPTQLNDTSLF